MSDQNHVPEPVTPTQPATSTVSSASEPDTPLQSNSPGASDDQKKYWQRDLRFKFWSLLISVSGILLVTTTVGINSYVTSLNTKAFRANVQRSSLDRTIQLDQVFIEKPDLRPYFYDGKPIAKDDAKYDQVVATAELMMDVFDQIAGDSKDFPEYYDDPGAWDRWMVEMFKSSPILRWFCDKYSHWYGPYVLELRKQAGN
jgi:hypothetical protein